MLIGSFFLIFGLRVGSGWAPGGGFEHFGPQIRILRAISSRGPAGKLWNPEPRLKSGQNYVFNSFF